MAKVPTRVRKVYKAFPAPSRESGLARVGETGIALPLEAWTALGSPRLVVLNVCGNDLHIFCAPCTFDSRAARFVSRRSGRTRCYIHVKAHERPLLVRDLYQPLIEFDERLQATSIRLKGAVC